MKKKGEYNQTETKTKHPLHPMCTIFVVTSKILGTHTYAEDSAGCKRCHFELLWESAWQA